MTKNSTITQIVDELDRTLDPRLTSYPDTYSQYLDGYADALVFVLKLIAEEDNFKFERKKK